MAVSEKDGGSQTAVIGTEHTLGAAITDAGTYQLLVTLRNMAKGDAVELRVKIKIRTGEVLEEVFKGKYANAQGNVLIAESPPQPGVVEFVATLKQTLGTGRVFVWSIVEY